MPFGFSHVYSAWNPKDNYDMSASNCNCNCNLFAVYKSNLGYIPVDVDIVIIVSSNKVFTES